MTDQVDQRSESSEVSSQESQPEIDVQALISEVQKLKATNERLLDESVQNKNKYKSLKTEIEQSQHQKLEEQENFKELYERERKKSYETSTKLADFQKKVLQKDMHYKVASMAQDAYDVADVINALPKERLQIDEDANSVTGVDEALSWVKENKPWLFKKATTTGMSDSRPQGNSGKRTWNDLSKEEKNAAFADSLKEKWFN